TPKPSESEDPENQGFVSISMLAKLGCFSGDLVHITTSKSEQRLIRLFSLPEELLPEDVENKLFLSPIMTYNIGTPCEVVISPLPDKTDDEAKKSLPYFPSTFSSSSYFLPKLAKQVTVSRIASPITTLRSLQPAFISSLQSYFNNRHRIVKQGDILAIPIDTVTAENLSGMSNDEAISVLNKSKDNLKLDAVAWFKVVQTTVENDSYRCNNTIEDGKSNHKHSEQVIIDVTSTRMIQSGLIRENFISSKLGWESYLELHPAFDYIGSNQENDQNFVYAKRLMDLLKVTLNTPISPSVLFTSSKRLVGKHTLISSVCQFLGLHLFSLNSYDLLSDTDAKTLGSLRARLDRAKQCGEYTVVEIRHIEGLLGSKSQDGKDPAVVSKLVDILDEYINNTTGNSADSQNQESEANGLILFATTSDADALPTSIRSKFKFEININVPTEKERKELFNYLISNDCFVRRDVNLDNIALQSAGLTPPDIVSIVSGAKTEAKKRLEIIKASSHNPQLSLNDLILISSNGANDNIQLIPDDFTKSISDARQKYSDSIGAPRIPNVTWNDVGGLDMVKKEILDTIEMPLKYPHLFSGGVKKRSGILFYGPPGTGKTLLAKAIASSFSLNFFSVKGPELLNMYIGESEANVRRVFEKARDARPCVIFFDELDSVAPKRGNQGDSGGVMDRIVSQLLAELDGMSGKGGDGVFVVGATNRPDLLDEALLRPGRFDKMLYLGISDTHEKQEKILEALTRKFTLSPEVSLARISQKCSFTYTGADFYALCSDAMLGSMIRTAKEVDTKISNYNKKLAEAGEGEAKPVSTRWWFENIAEKKDITVNVTEADFEKAQESLVPSVSAEELLHYLRVRETFEG
ncbi:AAA-domain-containing protein, partial [Nadsonia fulvescens var. elongata DSM 6958]